MKQMAPVAAGWPTPKHVCSVRSGRLRITRGRYFIRPPMWMPSSTAAITSNNNVRTLSILIVHLLLGKRELAHLLLDPLYLKTNECSIHNIAIR